MHLGTFVPYGGFGYDLGLHNGMLGGFCIRLVGRRSPLFSCWWFVILDEINVLFQ